MDLIKKYFIIFIICTLLRSFRCQNFFTRPDIMDGLSLPYEVQLLNGEDLFIKISKPVTGQTKCEFRSPGNDDVDVENTNSNRIKKWNTEQCGIHVTNVTTSDTGHWRLTSSNLTADTRGITVVEILENSLRSIASPNQIYSPFEDVAPEGTRYCYVLRPNEEKSEFPQHNKCMIPEIDKELDANGMWKVVAGIYGKSEEYSFQVQVDVKVEKLHSVVEKDTELNKIHLLCNIINSMKNITFCRFLRLADDTGFNMDEGIGSIGYRYRGNGIHKQECGMTIDEPTAVDRSVWKCYVGYSENNKLGTMGAILDASDTSLEPEDEITVDNVYGLNSTTVKILCKAKHAIDYCWFTHPSGRRITVSDLSEHRDSDIYRYHGASFSLGDCGVMIINSDLSDSGTWSCHAGNTDISRIESQKEFTVRVSESHLVASSISKNVVEGGAIIIECTSVPVHLPVDYCRFVLPNGQGFSINEDVTSENAIMSNYYFNPNRNRREGYCSIIVQRAGRDHTGLWTCAGRVTGRTEESLDDFTVVVEVKNNLSVAAIVGMAFGSIFILCGIIAIGILSYRRHQHSANNSNMIMVMD